MSKFKYEVLRGPLVDKFTTANRTFHNDGVVGIWPPGCAMFAEYRNHIDRVRHLTVRKDDVWIVTYPKAGEFTLSLTPIKERENIAYKEE
jgi:hypothetical protein